MSTTATSIAGRYRLDAVRGEREVGVVWEAFDELLQRKVAVKEIRIPDDVPPAEQDEWTERALREARAAAAVDTAAAVRVFDVVEQDGRPWVVMEVVPGRTLAEVLQRKRSLPAADVARVGLAVLEALDVAHRAGVVHCPVTAHNVILGTDGRIALSDFCVDLAADEEAAPAKDLHALGETLQEAVGRRSDSRLVDLVRRLDAADPPPVDDVRAILEQIVREQHRNRPRWPLPHDAATPTQPADAADESPTEAPSWPLVVALLGVLIASAVVLGAILQRGA